MSDITDEEITSFTRQLRSEAAYLGGQYRETVERIVSRLKAAEAERDELKAALSETTATLLNMWSDAEPEVRAYYTEVPAVLKQARTALEQPL